MFTKIELWVFLNLSFVPLFLWRAWTWNFPSGIPHWEWAFNGDGIRFRPAFWRWIFGERIGNLIFGMWGTSLAIFGILNVRARNLFIHVFALGSFIYLSLVATANVRHDYYQTVIIPSLVLLAALGVDLIYKEVKGNVILKSTLLVFIIGMSFGISGFSIKEFYKINHPEIVEAGEAVAKLTAESDLVIAPYNGDTAFLYHTKRRGWPINDSSIEHLMNQGASYYVSVNFNDPDTVYVMEKYSVVEKTDRYVIVKLN